jgi:DNA-binding XRE family transcriptional regulator
MTMYITPNISPSSNPLAFFAGEVKRMRAQAKMTQEQLAEAISYSPSTIAAVETCRLLPSEDLARALDKVLGLEGHPDHFGRLQGLVEETSVLPWFRDLPKMERNADEIRVYEPYQVPALLQIEDYSRAMARAERPVLSDSDIDKAVALRSTRQEILKYEDRPPVNYQITPGLWAIMDESVLHRAVGGPEVMKAQYEHLDALARQPNITVQVIANAHGPTCALGRAFEIIASRADSVVYLEDLGSARYVRKTDEADRYLRAFDHLRASALSEEQTLRLIKDLLT